MPRLSFPRCPLPIRIPTKSHTFFSTRTLLAAKPDSERTSDDTAGTSVHSGPGYSGRDSSDHAVNRTEKLDPQAKASHSGMAQHAKGEEGSQAISRKDEGNNNQRAKEDHPEAPGPVLGMNDERGGVSGPETETEVEDRAQGYAS